MPLKKKNKIYMPYIFGIFKQEYIGVKGSVEGYILEEAREDGFGYDPLFFYEPFNRTFQK